MNQPKEFSANYAKSLTEKLGSAHAERFPTLDPIHFEIMSGSVYDKIVERKYPGGGGSVHAFVNRATGDLIKAGSWSAPQKSKTHPSGFAVRYNISTPKGFHEAISKAGSYAYLYA